jgi:hypothetical protein
MVKSEEILRFEGSCSRGELKIGGKHGKSG